MISLKCKFWVHAVTDEQYAALLKCEQQTAQLVKENEQLLNEKNSANERFKMLSDLIGVKVRFIKLKNWNSFFRKLIYYIQIKIFLELELILTSLFHVAKNDEEESAAADAANAANAANANVAEVRFVWRNGGSKVFVVVSI